MKIYVISASKAKKFNFRSNESRLNNNFITIRDHVTPKPILNFYMQKNVLALQFDDIEETDNIELIKKFHYVLFNEDMAKTIHEFIDTIDTSKDLYVNCVAGVSRSGAVGIVLNEYFNRYLENNLKDYEDFFIFNRQIIPNATVSRILKNQLFGKPFTRSN